MERFKNHIIENRWYYIILTECALLICIVHIGYSDTNINISFSGDTIETLFIALGSVASLSVALIAWRIHKDQIEHNKKMYLMQKEDEVGYIQAMRDYIEEQKQNIELAICAYMV